VVNSKWCWCDEGSHLGAPNTSDTLEKANDNWWVEFACTTPPGIRVWRKQCMSPDTDLFLGTEQMSSDKRSLPFTSTSFAGKFTAHCSCLSIPCTSRRYVTVYSALGQNLHFYQLATWKAGSTEQKQVGQALPVAPRG